MSTTQARDRDRLRYTPGDGYVYGWDGGAWIEVRRIVQHNGSWTEISTNDVIPAPAVRTGTQLIYAVDEWRRNR